MPALSRRYANPVNPGMAFDRISIAGIFHTRNIRNGYSPFNAPWNGAFFVWRFGCGRMRFDLVLASGLMSEGLSAHDAKGGKGG